MPIFRTSEQLGSLPSNDPIAPAPDEEPPVDVGALAGQLDFSQSDFG
jgi:hypothetical protein